MARVPPAVVFLLVVGLFVGGVLTKGLLGAALLGLIAAGVVVLLAATWRVLSPAQRLGRVLVLALVVVIAVSVL
ncbi:hypothetical protein [Actinokineospora diospyrosa]|uniref:hypothetical protein n=1 Tax=Actinokineospora diospyrosa TaxID=103728 RepID=UPI0020A532CA|nr:hypothetical protein [Actinokineospora diospyrosa]